MAEELKHLIEQIQKEGVEKAEEQAASIISQAKEKAASIVVTAEEKANDTLLRAKNESEAFAERSVKTLEQAARDLLITVGQGCEKVVSELLGQEVDKAVSGDLLQLLIQKVVEQASGDIKLSLTPEDGKALAGYCAELAKTSGKEIELLSDSEILSGFKVGYKDKSVYLDYTGESIASALSAFLRPQLAKTVSDIATLQKA